MLDTIPNYNKVKFINKLSWLPTIWLKELYIFLQNYVILHPVNTYRTTF